MERMPLPPLPEGMFIDQIQEAEASLTITVIATHPTAYCPLCLESSFSIHSLYCHTLADVPCGGRQIQLLLTVRKFFCRNSLSHIPQKVDEKRELGTVRKTRE